MNKLKKALQMQIAHDSGRASSDQSQSRTAENSEVNTEPPGRNPEYPDKPNSPHARTGHLTEGAFADERLPVSRMDVDMELLLQFGLQPRDPDLEFVGQQFRRIKRPVLNIAFGADVPQSDNANVVMLASALPGSGKSFCSFNLASSIARERDIGAVLVDADVLKPYISKALGLEHRVGLIDYLLSPKIQLDDILIATNLFGIIVIPAGQRHAEATELLASRRMKKFFAELSDRFRNRMIIVDTPPLLLTNEAQVLAEHMGQVAMVVEAGITTQESVMQAIGSLDRSKPINVILNKTRGASFGEYYGSAYGDYGVPHQGRERANEKN